MKEYYYMFSQGSHSDHGVVCLYKSKKELGEQFFAETLRQMLVEQVGDCPEAVEMFKEEEWGEVLTSFGSKHDILRKLVRLAEGEDIYPSGTPERDSYRTTWQQYLNNAEIDTDFITKLVKDGVLEPVKYKFGTI